MYSNLELVPVRESFIIGEIKILLETDNQIYYIGRNYSNNFVLGICRNLQEEEQKFYHFILDTSEINDYLIHKKGVDSLIKEKCVVRTVKKFGDVYSDYVSTPQMYVSHIHIFFDLNFA